MRLIRSASSPSLISISAMPDSSSSSISFLIFRMSMLGNAPLSAFFQMSDGLAGWARSGWPGEVPHRGPHCQLVTERTQAGDETGRYVGEVGMLAERLAPVDVREVNFHERQTYREQRIPQGNAGMRKRCRIEYQKGDAGGRGAVDLADELGFRVALKRDELVAGLAGQLRRALFDRLERVRSVDPGLPAAEQV